MRNRSHEMRVRATARIVVVAAILVGVSLLSVNYFVRADLTARKEYTISDSSKRLLRELPDIVNVTAYMSENLPRHMTGFRTRIEDVLDEYRAYGGERVRITSVDPASDPETEREVQMLGIAPAQLQALERDRVEVVNAYLGMTVTYEDRQEVIPLVIAAERLEYELTSAILKVMTAEPPSVGFLTGHGERAIGKEYRSVADALGRNYVVLEVNLADDPFALAGIKTLVVAGAAHVPDAELFQIDQFLMRGGRALFLLDAVLIAPGTTHGRSAQGNVFDFVSSYGVSVHNELVVDGVSSNASFQSGFMTVTMPYPYWPKAVPPNLSRKNPVVSDLDAVAFPWTSPLAIADELPEGIEATVLAGSSGRSWTVPADSDLNPRQRFVPRGDAAAEIQAGRGPSHPLAVAVTGELTSAFDGKPVLVEDDEGNVEFTEPKDAIARGVPTQLIVVGNARMFEDNLLRQSPSNLVLFLNAIDWLTLGDTLIGIRSRAVVDRPLEQVSDAKRTTMKSLATFAVPAALICFGLVRAATKKRRRAATLRG